MTAAGELQSNSPRSFSRQLTTAGLSSIAIGVAITSVHRGSDATIGGWFIGGGLIVIIGYWAIAFGLAWGRAISAEMKVASTPVPSPVEIATHLEEEWGRSPTIGEVAAVHQMLTSRRNEALLGVGFSLGALYLVDQSLD
jgi:hypothetical protein